MPFCLKYRSVRLALLIPPRTTNLPCLHCDPSYAYVGLLWKPLFSHSRARLMSSSILPCILQTESEFISESHANLITLRPISNSLTPLDLTLCWIKSNTHHWSTWHTIAYRIPWWSLLRTFWLDTLRPGAKRKCLYSWEHSVFCFYEFLT